MTDRQFKRPPAGKSKLRRGVLEEGVRPDGPKAGTTRSVVVQSAAGHRGLEVKVGPQGLGNGPPACASGARAQAARGRRDPRGGWRPPPGGGCCTKGRLPGPCRRRRGGAHGHGPRTGSGRSRGRGCHTSRRPENPVPPRRGPSPQQGPRGWLWRGMSQGGAGRRGRAEWPWDDVGGGGGS